ncbi:MAG: hypothetical protein SVT56_11590 [Chloroflexota bacterium]|nr:hypothetical protein [Chloroflexota bacterium]
MSDGLMEKLLGCGSLVNMEDELISVSQVANQLGKQKKHIFKVLYRLGIERRLEKSAAARGQRVAYITSKDYKRVKEYFSGVDSNDSEIIVDSDAGGIFYLIQLEPEYDPGRFKLGFATNIEERLRSHKTAAPFSKVLKTWPCKLLWEKTAIECATQNCEKLHTEVFRSQSIEAVLSKCDQFFALMPEIKTK